MFRRIVPLLLSLLLIVPAAVARQTALGGTSIAKLLAKAKADNSVAVFIELRTPDAFQPEGKLDKAGVARQRAQIHEAQSRVLANHKRLKVTPPARYESIPFMAVAVDEALINELAEDDDVAGIEIQAVMQPTLENSVPQINAPALWNQGYTGTGWSVVVLDTGIDHNHTFINGSIVAEGCFSNGTPMTDFFSACRNGVTVDTSSGAAVMIRDDFEAVRVKHGTITAGVAVGAYNGTRSGVAKTASLIPVQIFTQKYSDPGHTLVSGVFLEGDLVAALQWVHNTARIGRKIAAINMSIANADEFYDNKTTCGNAHSAFKTVAGQLAGDNIALFAGAGNEKRWPGVDFPACSPDVIAVGAVSKDANEIVWVDSTYPDIFASNVGNIMGLWAPGCGYNNAPGITSSVPGGGFEAYCGTSLASPHAAGGFALLRNKWSSTNATTDSQYFTRLLAAVQNTGKYITHTPSGITKHRLDLDRADKYMIDSSTNGPTAPSNVDARATSATTVHLTWTASTDDNGIDHYEVQRRATISGTWAIPSDAAHFVTSTSFDDTGLTANTTYQYQVVAVDWGGHTSAVSNLDIATTVVFTDPAITANVSLIRALHVTELRTAINAVRASANLGAYTFTHPTLTANATAITAIDYAELRDALAPARSAIGLPAVTYGHATPASGGKIYATDLTDVRGGVQ